MNQIVKITKRELIEAYVTRSAESELLNNLLKQSDIGLNPNVIPDITPNIVYTLLFHIPDNVIVCKGHTTYRVI